MKAVIISRLGGPEVLQVGDFPDPAPAPGQEIVRVQAGGVNFADIMSAEGGYPGTPPPPLVAGREFCGVQQTTGKRVMGYAQWGAFAELAAANSDLLWPVPEHWSCEEAAAFPVNYFTAYLAYWKAGLTHDAARGRKSVLIHAVAGGVGTAAVQIGKLLGIEMYGTSSSDEKLARVKELGLQHAINYKDHDYEESIKKLTNDAGVDAVFEMLGGEHTNKSIRCLGNFGCVIVYGSASGQRSEVNTRLLYSRATSVHGLWLSQLSKSRGLMQESWQRLSGWAASGDLHPVVGNIFPVEKVQDAYRLLMDRKNFGKVVLKITG